MKRYTHRAPTAAGEILVEEFLKPLELSQSAFARHINWPQPKLNEIIQGRRGITPETALTFADALGTTPQFWLNMQLAKDLWLAQQCHKKIPALASLRKASA
jgi:antitoxin HigA-1